MNICVYGAASSLIDKRFTDEGEKLGKEIASRGYGLVFGGGANGMMGAAARGATEGNGYILGIVPEFFKEAGPEISYKKCTEYIYTETMRERKRLLEEKSDAFVVTPGGIGTFDEFFEVLTLKQLGRHNKPITILNINGFFDKMAEALCEMVKDQFITNDCAELCKVFTDIDQLLAYIEDYDPTDIDLSKVKIR